MGPLVIGAALAGDPGGMEILEEGLEHLLVHLEVVRSKWPMEDGPIPVALVGGLVDGEPRFKRRLETLVEGIGGRLAEHAVVPVRGAAQLALAIDP